MQYINKLVLLLEAIKRDDITEVIAAITSANNVFTAGNGGSATTAQHFAQGLWANGIRAHCLSDNIAVITAIANDFGYEKIFERQLAINATKLDLLICISVSGNSSNLLRATEYANEHQIPTIGILGNDGGKLKDLVKKAIIVNSPDYQLVEDAHLSITHIITKNLQVAEW